MVKSLIPSFILYSILLIGIISSVIFVFLDMVDLVIAVQLSMILFLGGMVNFVLELNGKNEESKNVEISNLSSINSN